MNNSETEPSERLMIAQKSIEAARAYTHTMLEGLTDEEWFWAPDGLTTHIAWQVGHMAYAQYGLVLFRQRGRMREDSGLMSNKFRKLFAKGSQPAPLEESLPLGDIRRSFEDIYRQSLKELPTFDEQALDDPLEPPYAGYPTKFGCLLMAGHHEMLHCGQIGLIRRLMGKDSIR